MDVDRQVRPAAHQRAGAAGVVEVDVGEQQRPRGPITERLQQLRQRGLRPRVDEDAIELPATDNPASAEVLDVYQPCYLTSTSVIMPLATCGGPPWRSLMKQKRA